MKAHPLKIAALALLAVPLYLYSSSCAPECVDFADCADKAKAAGQEFTCDNGVCKAGSPFPPDAGSTGGGAGGGGATGGGTGGGATGGGAGGGATGGGGGATGGGGGATGGGGGATGGGGGGMDAGMDDAGTDAGIVDAGIVDAGIDAGAGMDAGVDAGMGVDLIVNGTGYSPHANRDLYVALVGPDGGVLDRQSDRINGGGVFSVTFTGLLRAGESYSIDYYADQDQDMVCDAPPTDHVWRDPVPTVSALPVTMIVMHNTNFTPAACGSFP